LPKEGGFNGQRRFFPVLADYLAAMRGSGETTILTFFGNDDAHPLEPLLDELASKGLCVNLNGKVYREDGLVFCGINKVRDYPFGYKHWCVPDDDYVACPVQFCGQGLTLNERGQFVPLENLVAHLKSKPSIRQELETLKAQLEPEEMQRSIWLIHQPPSGLGLDICASGEEVGSPAILDFARQNQPLLGCSGHIHESPHQPGGRWVNRIGKTIWVQPGQVDHRLHYARLELSEAGDVGECWHSVFGESKLMLMPS
jgi:Icc-related predicted phosphoesterase